MPDGPFMEPLSLYSKPNFVSLHTLSSRPNYEEVVSQRVNKYFQENWPWNSDEQRDASGQAGLELWGLLNCPRAPEERAEITCAYGVFFFRYDDLLNTMNLTEARQSVQGVIDVMMGSRLPQNPIEHIIHNICMRMLALGDDRSRKLAHHAFVDTCETIKASSNHEERQKSLRQGLVGYLDYQVKDARFTLVYRLSLWEMNFSALPDRYPLDGHDFGSLIRLTVGQAILVNDMYSFRRTAKQLKQESEKGTVADSNEEAGGQKYNLYNAVSILLQEDGVDERNAMEKLEEHIQRNEIEFIATVKKLRARYSTNTRDLEAINDWMTTLTDIMAGNLYWSGVCGRYNT